jgi:hypothetical protein
MAKRSTWISSVFPRTSRIAMQNSLNVPRFSRSVLLIASFAGALAINADGVRAQQSAAAETAQGGSFLGFDRNIYPGDAALPVLRKTFSFASFWISPPPGEASNTWAGKRVLLREQGFGFVVLYRGREQRALKTLAQAGTAGASDARDGAANAKREGFAAGTIIFLDLEEGGRLSPAYHAYLRSWADTLIAAGYRPGVYCSAIPVSEGHRVTITTADDIRSNEAPREFSYWVYNDVCPPAPGCVTKPTVPPPAKSGTPYAAVWQFAQSPRRKEYTAKCAATYARDGNCYAPGDTAHAWFLDLNSATSADPSGGAK